MSSSCRKFEFDFMSYFAAVTQELQGLWLHLLFYRQLYDKTDDRVELFNEIAPGTFGLMQRNLQFILLMYVARLLDRARVGQYENISFPGLAERLREKGHEDLADQINAFLNEKADAISQIIAHRNKRLAHNDAIRLIDRPAERAPAITKGDFDDLIAQFTDLYNTCSQQLDGSTFVFEAMTLHDGGGDRLYLQLQRVIEYERLRKSIPMGGTIAVRRNLATGRIEWDESI